MKYYIIYELVKNEEGDVIDIINKYDSDNLHTISNWLGITYNHTSDYTARDIENINCKLKDNKYFIFKDYE